MKSITNIISIALIGGGAAGFAIVSKPLVASKEAETPLNVLGINRSPYGEVFAMAMQEPIDTYFHAAESRGTHKCDDSETCSHEQHASNDEPLRHAGVNDRVGHFIEGLASGLTERTNPRAASAAHRFHLRRGVEDKLRFAYNMDPGHYGNYNAYHFFLTEPQLGTRPELSPMAAKLANDTIQYCLNQRNDPRQALTAAAAAGNVIELMLNDRAVNPEKPRYTTAQMKEILQVMDQSIGLYSYLSDEWLENGLWENLSELRITEAQERLHFVLRIRDSHEKAIRRLEGFPDNSSASSRSISNEVSTTR
jgi:hypothetical protein